MSGHHNLTIYTGKDAEVCCECSRGELVKSAHVFSQESYICWSREGHVPTAEGCKGFRQAGSTAKSIFKVFKGV